MMKNYSDDSNGFRNFRLETIDTVQRERVCTSRIIDRRHSPRADTRLKAWMISGYGKFEGLVTNLSRSGLRFEAGSELPDLPMKNSGQKTDHPSKIVEICFEVPAQYAEEIPVVVQAKVVYVIKDDEENYAFGVKFRFFDKGEQALEDYLYTGEILI
jgi:hypothetical protein